MYRREIHNKGIVNEYFASLLGICEKGGVEDF